MVGPWACQIVEHYFGCSLSLSNGWTLFWLVPESFIWLNIILVGPWACRRVEKSISPRRLFANEEGGGERAFVYYPSASSGTRNLSLLPFPKAQGPEIPFYQYLKWFHASEIKKQGRKNKIQGPNGVLVKCYSKGIVWTGHPFENHSMPYSWKNSHQQKQQLFVSRK